MGGKERILPLMACILTLSLTYSILEVSAISQPNYLTHPEFTPSLITIVDDKLVVYDPVESSLIFISKVDGSMKVLKAPKEVFDIAVSNQKIFMATSTRSKLYVYNISGGDIEEIELPGLPGDLDSSSKYISVSLPDKSLVIVFDAVSLNELLRIEINVDHGLGKISLDDGFLYVVQSDGYTLAKIDLGKNEKHYLRIDERILALKAFNNNLLLASTDDRLYRVSGNLKIERRWSLERGSTIDIGLYMLSDGRIIYVARARWAIGEIDGDSISEVRVGGRIFGDVLDKDRIWFTEINTRKIGWVWLSRPPIVKSIVIEPEGGGLFKASAKIYDPDNEPIRATLIVTVKSKIPHLIADNRTYDMNYIVDRDIYVSEFQLKPGEEAEVYVVAIDQVNNIGVSEKIPTQYREEEAKTASISSPPTASPPPIELTDLYLIASSLLLLIPIIAAVIIMKTKKKPRKKPRK
ncbi:MAG: hypothetical protein LZ168_00270 [Thaumarchaeota archaeon]|nr:hypothetical protein [Candidatus Geocrenenecus arthurdayi]